MHVCQYVSTMADIVENTHTLRATGYAGSAVLQMFGHDTQAFSAAHLKALLFTIVTKERVELVQGQMLAAMFFVSAFLVNSGMMTKGQAIGILQAFISGSKDITDISGILIKMKFNSEGVRSVSRILNYPTDAHLLSARVQEKEEMLRARLQLGTAGTSRQTKGAPPLVRGAGSSDKVKPPTWASEIIMERAAYKCFKRSSLAVARRLEGNSEHQYARLTRGNADESLIMRISCIVRLGGMQLLRREKDTTSAATRAAVFGDEGEDPHNDVRAILMQMLCDVVISPNGDSGFIYKPPFLSYAYLGDTPVLLEGSILKASVGCVLVPCSFSLVHAAPRGCCRSLFAGDGR